MVIKHNIIEMNESVPSEEEIQTDVSLEANPDIDNNDEVLPPAPSSSEDQPKEDKPPEEEWLDILGNGQLKKKVIKQGQKDIKPQRDDICIIKFTGVLDDGTVVEEYDDLSIQVGDFDVIQGLDLTIVLMELGEVAEIKVDARFAYGTYGDGAVPPNATIMYTVELKTIDDEFDVENLSINQRRELGNKKRQRGNWWFVRKEFNFAIQCYRRAIQYLQINNSTKWNEENEETETVTDTELQTLLEDRIKVHNNLAAALIETGAYHTALENVDRVLKYQPKNTKALFRKGKILRTQGEYGKAYITLLEAQKVDPDMKSLQMELMTLKEKITKQNKKEKHLYAKMLGINRDAEKPLKDVKVEDKSKIAKGILWTLIGASAAVVGILIHRFAS